MVDAATTLAPPEPDVLGEPWVQRRIPLRPSRAYGRDPRAVLVHRRDAGAQPRAVLYLHGFTDYFFHPAHAERWRAAGFDFYALDLRLNGRALREGEHPGAIRDLRDHDEEIGLALQAIRDEGHQQVVLLGHSTGGLMAASWADRHPGEVDVVVLNSPWFDLNGPWFERRVLTPLVRLLGRVAPHVVVGKLQEGYGRFLHSSTGGEWTYELAWKPFAGFPARAGMVGSVRREQARLARGLDVREPVLLCCSARSGPVKRPTADDLRSSDCVLGVDDMVRLAPKVGRDVTVERIDGGVHDLALSPRPARDHYEDAVTAWATARLA